MTNRSKLKSKLLEEFETKWTAEDSDTLTKFFRNVIGESIPLCWTITEGELAKEQYDIFIYFVEQIMNRTREDITKRLIELGCLYE
jgi:hypothetical protein